MTKIFGSRGAQVGLLAVVIGASTSVGTAQLLSGANWFEREVGQGVVWRYYQFDNLFSSKQSISYMEVDLNDPGVDFTIRYREAAVGTSPPANAPRVATSTFAGEVASARAAINGTYFNTQVYDSGNPTNPWGGGTTYLKVGGSIVHTFDGVNVNNFGMGILYNSKSDLTFTRRPGSGGWNGIQSSWQNMMICGPVLLQNGVVETYAPTNDHANFRHPRSAIGLTLTNKLILLTADGRTSEAAGVSCTELANIMLDLGCDDAINMDGGGSTTLWASGEPYSGVVNYPSDNGLYDHLGQRSCANALVVTAGAPTPEPWDGRLNSLVYDSVTRTGEVYTVTASYTNIGTQTWTPSTVSVVPSRAFGRTSAFIPAGQETTFFSMNPASVATGQTATFTLTFAPPTVASDTFHTENFALWHPTEGFFGPADNELRFGVTVRPELVGAPPPFIVQGGATGPNNQWYAEPTGSWSNSTVAFSAPGVDNPGTQRYVGATSTGRSAKFSPVFDVAGIYEVAVAFPSSSNSVTVRYDVAHLQGTSQFAIDQNSTGGLTNAWNVLGQFQFSTGSVTRATGVHSVTIGNPVTTGNRFYSGAARFEYMAPLPVSTIGDWSLLE